MRFAVTDGTDRRQEGGSGENRLRADGSIVPRNSLRAGRSTVSTCGCRRRSRSASKVKVDGMIEVYNLFNHENYGSYTTNMANAQFGQPAANAALAYQPRMMQLGVQVHLLIVRSVRIVLVLRSARVPRGARAFSFRIAG